VVLNNLNPMPFGPSRSHVRHSAEMMRTRLVSEGCPRLLRSSTVTTPSARASLMAFLAVVRQTPARAAMAPFTGGFQLSPGASINRMIALGYLKLLIAMRRSIPHAASHARSRRRWLFLVHKQSTQMNPIGRK
jgi:hypothetical protein